MDKSKVLSPEEVDLLLKTTQERENDLSKLISRHQHPDQIRTALNNKAIGNIIELTWSECEKIFSSFIRKKIIVRPKGSTCGKLSECLDDKSDKHVYTVFYLMPNSFFSLVVTSYPLLHQMINALYGGVMNNKEPIMEAPGKVGVYVAEKLAELAMEGFSLGSKEYGKITFDTLKTVTTPNLISKLSMDDEIYTIEYALSFGEIEQNLTLMLPLEFLQRFIPNNVVEQIESKKSKPWRTAIENQVIDSQVNVVASLPALTMRAKDLMTLKEGDLIPISDPTVVNIFLNDIKLFSATAAQANESRIVKILSEN
jgi:flagellar motor switch protein FliM